MQPLDKTRLVQRIQQKLLAFEHVFCILKEPTLNIVK